MIQNKIKWHSVQSPLYYNHFEITEFKQSVPIFIWSSSQFGEERKQEAYSSYFVPETEMMVIEGENGAI